MLKIKFWGWYSDYDCYTIDSLSKYCDTTNVSMSKNTRFFLKVIKILLPCRISSFLIGLFLRRELNKEGVLIFSDDIIYYPGLIMSLDKPRKIVVFRNVIKKDFYERIVSLKEKGFELYTFDPSDAEFFGIVYKGQYLPVYPCKNEMQPENSAYFLGLNKGRKSILERLATALVSKGVTPNIIIVDENTNRSIFSQRKRLSYRDNIASLNKSKYIIDIVQSGQNGLTLRALESAFYRRKLITNNKFMRDCDLFNENNILILDDDLNIPNDFLVNNYIDLPESVLHKYRSDIYYLDIIGIPVV